MRIVVAAVTLGLLLLLAYFASTAELTSMGATGNGVPAAAMRDEAGSREERNLRSEQAAQASVRKLRIVNADGTPAVNLPVWIWDDEVDRPLETYRVPSDAPHARGGAGLGPPDTDLRTDGDGCVPDLGPHVLAVTVEVAPDLHFSSSLPALGKDLVLPQLARVEARLIGAPPGTRWEGSLGGAWLMPNGDYEDGYLRENVDTPSGPSVVSMRDQSFMLDSGSMMSAYFLAGHLCTVSAKGRGCEIVCDTPNRVLSAPGQFLFHCERAVPEIRIRVVDSSETTTHMHGWVWGQSAAHSWSRCEELLDGEARLDCLDSDSDYLADVMMDDGEWIQSRVSLDGRPPEETLVMRRGTGTPALRVGLANAKSPVASLTLDNRDCVMPYRGSTERAPRFLQVNDALLLNILPSDWRRGRVILEDGSVGFFEAAGPGETVQVSWLPSREPVTLDAAAILNGGSYQAISFIEVCVALRDDLEDPWVSILTWGNVEADAQPTKLPVWRGVRLPKGHQAELVVTGPDGNTRRFDLTR